MYSSLRRERRTVLLEPGGQTVCAPIVNPTHPSAFCATPRNPACHRPSPAWRARQAWSDYTHRNLGRRTLVGRLAHHAGEIGNTPDGLTSQTFRLKSEAFITEGKNLAHAVRFGPRTVADVAPLPPTHRRPAIVSGKVIYRTVASRTEHTCHHLAALVFATTRRPIHRIPAANRASPPTKNGRQSQRRNLAPRFVRVCTGAGLACLEKQLQGSEMLGSGFALPAISPGLDYSMAPTRPSSP